MDDPFYNDELETINKKVKVRTVPTIDYLHSFVPIRR